MILLNTDLKMLCKIYKAKHKMGENLISVSSKKSCFEVTAGGIVIV